MPPTTLTSDALFYMTLTGLAIVAWYLFRKLVIEPSREDDNGRRLTRSSASRIMERIDDLASELAEIKVSIATIIEKLSHHDEGVRELRTRTDETEKRIRWIETEHAKNHGHRKIS